MGRSLTLEEWRRLVVCKWYGPSDWLALRAMLARKGHRPNLGLKARHL